MLNTMEYCLLDFLFFFHHFVELSSVDADSDACC